MPRLRKANGVDARRLKDSFANIAMHGDEVPLFFYSDLFIRHPEVRDLFPVSMKAQRDHLVAALAKVISQVDRADELAVFLKGLGRDHRKFGVMAEHYDSVRDSLVETIAHFSGDAWTPELATDWTDAYSLIADIMLTAAKKDESTSPAFWQGTVLSCERKAFDISVLQVRPEPRLDFTPGQSVAIESPARPRLWRYYSMANAPREDGTLEFHVRLIDGGAVSMALTHLQSAGSTLRLGPPVGVLTLDRTSGSDILMIGGSTGLAPLKAMIEQIATLPQPRKVHLFFFARTMDSLYDVRSLEKLAAEHDWLTVVAVATADPKFEGQTGSVADVVARSGSWTGREVYIAGPTEMVRETSERLISAGTPREQIHVEDFGWSEP
jgi:NAD(P)H-flavin reductase/hemoglobin-like flavoprotein